MKIYSDHAFNNWYRFSAFWLRSKCSICSYQLNIWYEGHRPSSILNWFLDGDRVSAACCGSIMCWPCIAVPQGSAHFPTKIKTLFVSYVTFLEERRFFGLSFSELVLHPIFVILQYSSRLFKGLSRPSIASVFSVFNSCLSSSNDIDTALPQFSLSSGDWSTKSKIWLHLIQMLI